MVESESRRDGFRRPFVSRKPNPSFPLSSAVARDNRAADKRVVTDTPRSGLRRPRVETSGLRDWDEEEEAEKVEAGRRSWMAEQRRRRIISSSRRDSESTIDTTRLLADRVGVPAGWRSK
jgi:hypothetical protein